MKRMMVLVVSLFASAALAQVCDVTYSFESETMDGQDVGNGSITLFAQPMSEVDANHKSQMKVLDAMSKEQDAKKGGIYRTDVSEYRSCDGGAKVKNAEGSASIQGISYAGSNRIADEMLKQGKVMNDRHKVRAAKGETTAWDHKKAKKVKRTDLGVKIKD